MRLSQAIRKGCEGTYQITGDFSDGANGYCVMGAALKGLNGDYLFDKVNEVADYDSMRVLFPILKRDGKIDTRDLWIKNDNGWTRERIADWVESIENQAEVKVEPCPMCNSTGKITVVNKEEHVHA